MSLVFTLKQIKHLFHTHLFPPLHIWLHKLLSHPFSMLKNSSLFGCSLSTTSKLLCSVTAILRHREPHFYTGFCRSINKYTFRSYSLPWPLLTTVRQIWRMWGCRRDQERNNLKITHKYRPATAWFKVFSSFSVKLHLIFSIFTQTCKLIINPGAESSSHTLSVWCYKGYFSTHKNFSAQVVRFVLGLLVRTSPLLGETFTTNSNEKSWLSLHILC